jgi:hypothetical protein
MIVSVTIVAQTKTSRFKLAEKKSILNWQINFVYNCNIKAIAALYTTSLARVVL